MSLLSTDTTGATTPGPTGNDTKKPVPKWIPISMLAVSTVAMVAPVYFLRRARTSHRQHSTAHATSSAAQSLSSPAPRRRTGAAPLRLKPSSTTATSTALPSSRPTIARSGIPDSLTKPTTANAGNEDYFNAPLYTAKAFGIATFMVTACAFTTVVGVKTYMGVKDTQEFATRMRFLLADKMPLLSERLYRAVKDGEQDHEDRAADADTQDAEPWTWDGAEKRLSTAYSRGGFSAWAEAALQELEKESRLEKLKQQALRVEQQPKS